MIEVAFCLLLIAAGAALMLAAIRHRNLDVQVRRLQLQPGDIVVLSAPRPISPEQARRIKAECLTALDTAVNKVMVLDDGLTVDVLQQDAILIGDGDQGEPDA